MLSIFIDTSIGKNSICIVAFPSIEKKHQLHWKKPFALDAKYKFYDIGKTLLTLEKTHLELEIGKNTANIGKNQQLLSLDQRLVNISDMHSKPAFATIL